MPVGVAPSYQGAMSVPAVIAPWTIHCSLSMNESITPVWV